MYNNSNNGYNNSYGQQGYGGRGQMGGRGGGLFGINPLGMVVKGVASGIGLASEGIHAHKEKKAAKKAAQAEAAHRSPSQSPAQGPSDQADYMGRPQGSRQPSDNSAHYSPRAQSDYGTPPAYEEGENYHVRPEKHRSDLSERAEKGAYEGERELEEGDEEQWDLDDAQDELIEREAGQLDSVSPKKRKFEKNPKTTAQNFINDYPLPHGYHPHGRLTLPVVIPQRRPKDRSRGFIRAYAPELITHDIDEAMFLDFIETLDLASQASPWINAINLAGFATLPLHLAPGIGQAVTLALYLTVSLMKNMDSRKRCRTVLDQFNEQFFQPRGLYCMVLTWTPETDATEVGININEKIHQNLTPPEGLAKVVRNFSPSMGRTNGVAFTETAPLVFPVLDKLDDSHSGEAKTTKEKMKAAMGFTGEYFDRRAQAKFAATAPDSQLVVGPKPTFTSRYSDPNNASNSGDILALLTAGKLTMSGIGRGGLGGMGGGIGSIGGMGGGMGGMTSGGIPRGLGGFGGGIGYDRFGRPIGGGLGGGMGGGPLGMLGMLTSSAMGQGRMGGGMSMNMGGMSQQQRQEQMMLDQEQMMLNQQQGYNQQYPNQYGYNQQYPSQISRDISPNGEAGVRDLDPTAQQTTKQQLPSQQYPQQAPNQQYPQQMPNQMYPQQMGGGMYPQQMGGGIGGGVMGVNPIQLVGNGVKRILSHHVLYLLVVNMPTEEEMADATKFMDQMREAQKQGS